MTAVWLKCFEPHPWASLRLFCLPHAGGSAVAYRTWAPAATAAVEVHAAQYPGRADRIDEPMVDDAGRLAALLAGAMEPLLDRPAALFGHSMGALLAYEVARLLQERGTPPVHLFVSAARAPHDPGDRAGVSGRDDDAVVAELARLGGTDAAELADPELRALVLPYVRNDFRLVEGYRWRPDPMLAVPVTALAGEDDPDADGDLVRRWAEVTSGAFALRTFPGGHFYLAPRRTQVIGAILRTLRVRV